MGGLNLILFIFGCVGSSLPCRLPLVAASRGCSLVTGLGFSLRWLLLLKSMGSRARGLNSLVAPWHVGSSRIGIELMSPALADGLPLSYQGSPKPVFSPAKWGWFLLGRVIAKIQCRMWVKGSAQFGGSSRTETWNYHKMQQPHCYYILKKNQNGDSEVLV